MTYTEMYRTNDCHCHRTRHERRRVQWVVNGNDRCPSVASTDVISVRPQPKFGPCFIIKLTAIPPTLLAHHYPRLLANHGRPFMHPTRLS